MSTQSPLAILNEITKRSPDKLSIEIISEKPYKYQISFQSHVSSGSDTTRKKALQNAAEEMLKLIDYKKVSLNRDHFCVNSMSDSNADNLKNVNHLKQLCSWKQIAEPSFEVLKGSLTMINNTTVLVKCHVQDTSWIGIGVNEDKARDHSASLMLEHLKLKLSIPNDNYLNNRPDPSTAPIPSTDDNEIAEATLKYCSISSNQNLKGHTIPQSPLDRLSITNQHLAGKCDPFFTTNEKMLELKKASNAFVLTHPDPFSLLKDTCDNKNVKFSVNTFPSIDDSCCVAVEIHTNGNWTMISDGINFVEARNDACRRILLLFKTLMN